MRHEVDFFKDEVRNGFYIPTAIKQAWASILDVLKEIDDICQRHDIRYFADWGTLLGTVRHGGFIPWDDDLDICMLRDDYIRFRQVADAELPDGFVIHDFERRDDHWLFLSRVVNSERICFDEEYLNAHYNFPYLACVDIFVMDYLYRDEEKEKARDKEIMDLISMSYGLNSGRLCLEQIADKLAQTGTKYGFTFSGSNENHRVERELYRLAQTLMMQVSPSDSDRVGYIFPWVIKGSKGTPKEYVEKTVRLPFEDITMPVPCCYNEALHMKYGNYCEVRKVWGGHDYPFFEGQRRDLEAVNGAPLPGYSFDPGMLHRPNAVQGSTSPRGSTSVQESTAVQGSAVLSKSAMFTETDQTAYIDDTIRDQRLCEDDDVFNDEILILPTGPERWECFAALYERFKSEGTAVCVVPLPVMRKNVMGEIISTDDEIWRLTALDSYPEGVEVTDWLSYDISEHRPREIYIQDPYDEQNPVLTVPPAYYASVLRLFTGRLVFVPFKKTGEFGEKDSTDQYNLKHYLIAPGVIYSDVVYAYSENLRQQYINALTVFSGGEYRPVWEKKIVVAEYGHLGESMIDPEVSEVSDVSDVSDALGVNENSLKRKKKLLYCIGLNEITECGEIICKAVKERLVLMARNSASLDVSVAFYPSDFGLWQGVIPCVCDKYGEPISTDGEKGKDEGWAAISSVPEKLWDMVGDLVCENGFEMVMIDPSFADDIAHGFDAYYGSPSPMVPAFSALKKPVMLADHGLDL